MLRLSRSKPIERFYTLCGTALQEVPHTPYLGVQIANNLKWEVHINKTCGKANSTLGFLRRNLKHCPQTLKEQAYFSLVRSKLEYAACVWDPHLVKDTTNIEKVQRRRARFVLNKYNRSHNTDEMLEDLQWQSLKTRRKHQRLSMMYKITNGLMVASTDPLIPNTTRTRKTNSKQYKVISASTDQYKFSF